MKDLQKFKAYFVQTTTYADLNTQFPIMEIFEINDGKFEIQTVQEAYVDWSQSTSTYEKRADFTKNLNHLIDNKHAVIPTELSWDQLQTLSDNPEFFELWQAACTGDSGEDCACLAIQAIHKALIQIYQGASL